MELNLVTKDKKDLIKIENKEEFLDIIRDLTSNTTVQEMKQFCQHCDTSCYDHCFDVAYGSYLICKKLGLDYVAAARGGMLHDLFLYNWRHSSRNLDLDGLHAFVHPKIALANAMKLFHLNEKEKDIIEKHMWPVTFFRLPKYVESYIITFVDKYSASKETLQYFFNRLHTKRVYKYAYVFLSLIVFRIV